MAQRNILGVMEEQGVVRAALNPDGSHRLTLANGDTLQSVAPVYALPGITISGVATLPNANTFQNGAVVMLHKDNFVGAGANPCGIEIKADALNNVWRPRGPQRIWSSDALGTRALPTVSMTTTGRFGIGIDPILPAGLICYNGAKLRFSQLYFTANAAATTGATPTVYIGTDLVTYTNNKTILDNASAASNNLSYGPETLLTRVSATAALSTRSLPRGSLGVGNSVIQDVSGGLLNYDSAQMISYALAAMGSATKVDMLGFEIVWEY